MFLRIGRGVSINLFSLKAVQEWADGSFTLFPAMVMPGELPSIDVPAEAHDQVAKALTECGWRGRYQEPPPSKPTPEEMAAFERKMAAQNHSRVLVPPAGSNLTHIR